MFVCYYILCICMISLNVVLNILLTKFRYICICCSAMSAAVYIFLQNRFYLCSHMPNCVIFSWILCFEEDFFYFCFSELHTWKQSGSVCCWITHHSSTEYPSKSWWIEKKASCAIKWNCSHSEHHWTFEQVLYFALVYD